MPWDSRIQSEPVRRVVIALVMGAALALVLGLAWLQARQVHGERHVALAPQRIGPFVFGRPAGWSAQPAGGEGNVTFTEPGGTGSFAAVHLSFARPAVPDAALGRFIEAAGGQPPPTGSVRSLRAGPMSMSIASAAAAQRRRVVAALSVDGQQYLIVSYDREGRASRADGALMELVLASVRDERFVALGDRLALPVGLTIEAPPGLKALGYAADRGLDRVLFYPETDPRFTVLRFSTIDLTQTPQWTPPGPAADSTLNGRGPSRRQVIASALGEYARQDPAERLQTHLLVDYDREAGALPLPGMYGQFSVAGEIGFVMVMRNTPALGHEAVWGVTLGAEEAARVELAAEFSARDQAHRWAGDLVQALVGARERPEPPTITVPVEP